MDTNKTKTQNSLNISDEVLSTIAQNAIKEIAGVYSLAIIPMKYNLLLTPSTAKSIKIEFNSGTAQIDVGIVINMEYKIKDVCEQVQASIKDVVQDMAGITVSKVNVFVTGVHISSQQ